eukprot:TRINITY_DN40973_c0_g1_i1.p1 TRINITY_DN40973_c0_g1~~TRINITY_DN40973_c0_g1_i1.p1  ORF type:complete len:290 (-),score=47.78 TRINITY_DN40973_c0_g1_i1:95-964(-)
MVSHPKLPGAALAIALVAVLAAFPRAAFLHTCRTTGAQLRPGSSGFSAQSTEARWGTGGEHWRPVGILVAGCLAARAVLGSPRRPRSGKQQGERCVQATLAAARLHGHPNTRSPLVNWYCHEFDVPLDMVDPRPSPHPFGQVPHLSDDGGVEVFESGAILLYLADKYGGLDSPEARARYTKWVVWANSTLEEVCFGHRMSGTQIASPGKVMDRLEEILGTGEWLVDNQFSVADVAVGSYLNYVPVFFGGINLTQRPNVAAYMKRCAARPAFVKAFGESHASAVQAQVQG